MTTKQILWAGGAVIVLSVIIGVLLPKACHKEKPVVLTPTMQEVDRINELEKKEKEYQDSIVTLKNKFLREADSLRKIVNKQQDILSVKDIKLSALTREAALNKKYKDTAAYLVNCDSAFAQIEDAAIAVRAYAHENIVLRNSLDSAIGQSSLLVARKDYLYSELRESYDKLADAADNMSSENVKLNKKVSRKNVVGFQVGGTYFFSDKKVHPYVGIGITRQIFAF